jgi:uncharacterized protein YpmB
MFAGNDEVAQVSFGLNRYRRDVIIWVGAKEQVDRDLVKIERSTWRMS